MPDNATLLLKRYKTTHHPLNSESILQVKDPPPTLHYKKIPSKSVPLTFQKFVSSTSDHNGIYRNSTRTSQTLPEIKPKYERIEEMENSLARIRSLRDQIVSQNSQYLLVTNYSLTEKTFVEAKSKTRLLRNNTQVRQTQINF